VTEGPHHPMVSWLERADPDSRAARLLYRGELSDRPVRLHYSFDGWEVPAVEVELEQTGTALYVSPPIDLHDHVFLDAAFTDGQEWDNNLGMNYRLWVSFDPIDSHLHVAGEGGGNLGLPILRAAMGSMGIRSGIVSWVDNRAVSRLPLAAAGLYPLIWVRPDQTPLREVEDRLGRGFIGLKLHPTVDDYRADDPSLDPYLALAEAGGYPVACHTAPGTADPNHVRALAERFPSVPILLYHTYLGPDEGRLRAARHVVEQPNLYLETSWCRSSIVLALIDEVGADRVLFGSDASIDGGPHYCREPPNVDGVETYHDVLMALSRHLDVGDARKVTSENAERIFRLEAPPR
jgi:Amidohydrolase/Starch/carbohydrate-binding module (family 53)